MKRRGVIALFGFLLEIRLTLLHRLGALASSPKDRGDIFLIAPKKPPLRASFLTTRGNHP